VTFKSINTFLNAFQNPQTRLFTFSSCCARFLEHLVRFEMQKCVFIWQYNCIQSAQIPSPWRSACRSAASIENLRWRNIHIEPFFGRRRKGVPRASYCTLTTEGGSLEGRKGDELCRNGLHGQCENLLCNRGCVCSVPTISACVTPTTTTARNYAVNTAADPAD